MSNGLTAEDKVVIKEWSDKFSRGLDALEKAKQLNVGDFLVLYTGDDLKSLKLQTNSYGAPVKYKVVHSTEHGIPFCKKVSKKGNTVGQLYSCTGGLPNDDYSQGHTHFEFRLDPDYADAILLQDEYDPAALHRSRQNLWKEVTQHNKKVKVDTRHLGGVVEFFKSVNIGETLWASYSGYFLIQDKQTMTRQDFKQTLKDSYTNAKGPYVIVLTVLDKNKKIRKITADFFYGKALYRERPRTYKELKT